MFSWRGLLFWGLILAGAWHGWQQRAVHPAPGILVPDEPIQSAVGRTPQLQKPGYTITALASFDIEARVLAKEIYRADAGAELAPVDLALGWGIMSDSAVLDKLSISQGNRFYFWSARDLPADPTEIAHHSANMHLIPADKLIRNRLDAVRPGQVVHLTGYLVEATRPDGWHWRSSLTRNDTGPGACELIWVETAEVL